MPIPMTDAIATDLLTPLGAYLRLRAQQGARGAFLLESVDRGRLGRYSFVGCGSRLVSFEEAERLGEPVVGYLGYDAVARFEPTVPLPVDGPDLPESLFVVPDILVRFDHAQRDRGRCSSATRPRSPAREPEIPHGTGRRAARSRRFPDRDEHLRRVERAKEHIREGDVFQVVVSQRAERPTSASRGGAVQRAPARQPVAVPLPARARRPRARRQLAGDGRQVRGLARDPEPDRRHDRARARATPSGSSPRRRTAPST